MKIKCPNCQTEYEPAWDESNDCPICGNGSWRYIKTASSTDLLTSHKA